MASYRRKGTRSVGRKDPIYVEEPYTRTRKDPIYVDEQPATYTRTARRNDPVYIEEPRFVDREPIYVNEPSYVPRPVVETVYEKPVYEAVYQPRPVVVEPPPIIVDEPIPPPPVYIETRGPQRPPPELGELQDDVKRLRKECEDLEAKQQGSPISGSELEALRRELEELEGTESREWKAHQNERDEHRRRLESDRSLRLRKISEFESQGQDDQELDSVVELQRRLLKTKDEEIRHLSEVVGAHKEQIALLQFFLKDGLEDIGPEVLHINRRAVLEFLGEPNELAGPARRREFQTPIGGRHR